MSDDYVGLVSYFIGFIMGGGLALLKIHINNKEN